jgi:two-component system sensor histidine kinase/response regulator
VTTAAGMPAGRSVGRTTGSRTVEEALQESEDRFRSAFDHAPIGMALVDLDGRYLDVNPALCAIIGWTAEQLRQRATDDITHPDDRVGDGEVRRRLVAGELTSCTFEKRYVSPEGAPVWASTSVSLAHRGIAGVPPYFVVQVLDIRERKAAEQDLADERRRLRDAQAIGRIGSWERELATGRTVWSRTLFDLYGIAPNAAGADPGAAWRAIHPDDRPHLRAQIAFGERTGETFRARYRFRRVDDGALRWMDVRGKGICEDGVLVRIGGSVTDVTEQVHAARELELARDAALEASRAKSAFLATMSHEIRTPLNAVIGLTDLLLDTHLDGAQRDYLGTVRSSGQTLLDLISDVLDWSKIESGALVLEERPFELRDCVQGALEIVAAQPTAVGPDPRPAPEEDVDLDLRVQFEASCPEAVVGDRLRLRQILVNLIGNAVKFTRHGHVVVRAWSPTGPVEGPARDGLLPLRISVTDTGIGIPSAALERLFQDFTQVDDSTTRTYGGTGLGLAISQRLARAMGGAISVRSEPGVGSTFTVDLSLRPAPTDHPPATDHRPVLSGSNPETREATRTGAAAGAPTPPTRVLLVEDNPVNRTVAKLMLDRLGYPTEVSVDGREAVAAAARTPFDVILMDVQMPVMDGLEATRELRRNPPPGPRPWVIALTANALLEDRERCAAAGMDDYLSKPVRRHELAAVLSRRNDVSATPVSGSAGPAR